MDKKHRLSNNCFTGDIVPFGQQKGNKKVLLPIIVSLGCNYIAHKRLTFIPSDFVKTAFFE